jgi:hypothetical protein
LFITKTTTLLAVFAYLSLLGWIYGIHFKTAKLEVLNYFTNESMLIFLPHFLNISPQHIHKSF